jgi:hypothetical protein
LLAGWASSKLGVGGDSDHVAGPARPAFAAKGGIVGAVPAPGSVVCPPLGLGRDLAGVAVDEGDLVADEFLELGGGRPLS